MADARTIARRARRVALLLAFLAGVGIMAYPFVSNFIFQLRADRQLEELSNTVRAGSTEDYAAEIAAAQKYNEELVGQTVPDVFAIREGTQDKEYEGFLNPQGNQVMGSVEIPLINVHLPIYHYSTEETLLKGCGHIFGSSLPVGGESSHAVITAHRGLPAAKLFTDLDQLREGDQFYIKVLAQTLAYEVDNIEVVEPHETRSLAIKRGEDLVTLVTCTPYGVNTDRLRLAAILSATLLTAASVSVSGMIGWIGLVIPHLCRKLVGNNCRFLVPASMLMGASFLLLVDDLARNLLSVEIPIGILTAFIGAPFFLFLMTRKEAPV